MKARLTVLAAATALSMSVLTPAAQAGPAPDPKTERAKASKVAWGYVSSKKPKKSFYKKKAAVPVGRSGGSVHRAYYSLDISDAASEEVVSAVRLRIPVKAPNPCRRGGAPAVKVQQTRPFTAKTTWKKQPKVLRTLGTVKPKCSGKALELDLTKAAVRVLAQGDVTLGVRLVATNEKKAKKSLKLAHSAKLTVRASSSGDDDGDRGFGDPAVNRPQAVTGAALNGGGCRTGAAAPTIRTGTATFAGSTADADGGFIGLRVEWETVGDKGVQDSAMQFSTRNERRAFAITLPAGTFKKDGEYRWRLQGFDDFGGGPWTPWCEFEVDLPAAPVTPPADDEDAAKED